MIQYWYKGPVEEVLSFLLVFFFAQNTVCMYYILYVEFCIFTHHTLKLVQRVNRHTLLLLETPQFSYVLPKSGPDYCIGFFIPLRFWRGIWVQNQRKRCQEDIVERGKIFWGSVRNKTAGFVLRFVRG